MEGRLVLEVESINLIARKPYFKGLKAFAVVQYKNEEKRGQPRKLLGTIHNWGETFDFNVEGNPKTDCIFMDVYKEKNKFDKLIGKCKISLYDASIQRGEPTKTTYSLTMDGTVKNKAKDSNNGHITILLRYYPSAQQLQAALQKAENQVHKLERDLYTKMESQSSILNNRRSTNSTDSSLAATINKVEQLRLQSQVQRLENEMKWSENNAKWTENNAKWTKNNAKWTENNEKWTENDQKIALNQAKWAANKAKWTKLATTPEAKPMEAQSMLELCKILLIADFLRLGDYFMIFIASIWVWLMEQITCLCDVNSHGRTTKKSLKAKPFQEL